MKVTYDPEADAMYLYVRKADVSLTREIDDYTIIDFDKKNEVIGIELLDVRKRHPELLKQFGVRSTRKKALRA